MNFILFIIDTLISIVLPLYIVYSIFVAIKQGYDQQNAEKETKQSGNDQAFEKIDSKQEKAETLKDTSQKRSAKFHQQQPDNNSRQTRNRQRNKRNSGRQQHSQSQKQTHTTRKNDGFVQLTDTKQDALSNRNERMSQRMLANEARMPAFEASDNLNKLINQREAKVVTDKPYKASKLSKKKHLKRAFIAKEVLDKPLALRKK